MTNVISLRREPLEGLSGPGNSAVFLEALPPVPRFVLRARPQARLAAAAPLGMDLPTQPCRASTWGERACLWLGPDEWLLLSPDAPALAAYGSDLFIAWRGDGNTNLNASLVGIVNGTINGFTTPKYLIQTNISNLPVKAGDTLSLQVQYSADKSRGIVSIQNVTQKTKLTPITLVPPPGAQMLGQTAEWILEALQLNVGTQSQYAHIPAFTLTKFTNASASLTGSPTVGNPINATIVAVENDEQLDLTLTSRGNQTVTISYVPQSQSHVVSATELETAASVS